MQPCVWIKVEHTTSSLAGFLNALIIRYVAVFCENWVKNTLGIFRRRVHVPMKLLAGKPTQVASELKTAHGFLPLSVPKELGILYKILYKPCSQRKAVKACFHDQEWISRNIILFPFFALISSSSFWIMPERFVTYPLHPQNTHTHLPRSVMTVTGFAYLEEKMKRFKRCFGNCTSTTGSVFICFSFSQPHQASEGLPWVTE